MWNDPGSHFEGGINGEDENGNWIVGYGMSGAANIVVAPDHVEFRSVGSEPCGIPPLAEQKRIVERVDAILAECRKISQ